MTKVILTKELNVPFRNDFPSVMVVFDKDEPHFDAEKLNWLPKHSEIFDILRLMAEFEDTRYPQEKGFQGRMMLFEEIKKIFINPTNL